MTAFSELLELLKDLSVRTGRFQLASGRISDLYVDVRQTALHPRGAQLLGEQLLARVRKVAGPTAAVAGVELGGVPLATAVSLASLQDGSPPLPALVVRKGEKSHGTGSAIEGRKNVPDGAALVLVEDTLTSGGSAVKAITRLREAGFVVLAVVGVVDRQEGGSEALAAIDVPLDSLFSRDDLFP